MVNKMGFDMRGNNGRCPPFLLAGCILLCIVLTCNWWSISSQNYDLIKQIDILEEQMRICFRERDQCVSERSKLETNVAQLNIHNDEQKVEKDAIIKRRDQELTLCTTELESLKNLDASKTESLNTLRTDLDQKKEEIKRLHEKIKFVTLAMKELKNQEPASKVADDKTKDDRTGTENREKIDDVGLDIKGTTELNIREKDGDRDVQMANE